MEVISGEHVVGVPVISEAFRGKARSSNKKKGLAQSILETVGLKLSFKNSRNGGVDKAFKQSFCVRKGERLLRAFRCCLSTTAGQIVGMIFISTDKIAFRSDQVLEFPTTKGDTARQPYKVLIPIKRVKKVNQSKNTNKPEQRYVQVVTVDGFEFWFMGVSEYQTHFSSLQHDFSDSR